MALAFTHDLEKKKVIVTISGYFDFSLNTEFKKICDLDRAQIETIEVNLRQVEYLDSSALGMLLLLRDMVNGDPRRVVLLQPQQDVLRILNIANFDRLFSIR